MDMDSKGQMNLFGLLSMIIGAVAIAIGLMVFGTILPNLNQSAIGSSAYNLLQQTPIIVAGVALLIIVIVGLGALGARR